MRRRHAISPGFSGHYRDLGISSLKRHDSVCNLIISVGLPVIVQIVDRLFHVCVNFGQIPDICYYEPTTDINSADGETTKLGFQLRSDITCDPPILRSIPSTGVYLGLVFHDFSVLYAKSTYIRVSRR